VFNVHNNWMFNVISHRKGEVGGILFRAAEPISGIDIMSRNRPVEKIFDLTNGPGKLSEAMGINQSHDGIDMAGKSEVFIADGEKENFAIGTSFRIGVRKDLEEHYRYFVMGSKFVSYWKKSNDGRLGVKNILLQGAKVSK
jgi:DNA-3-methyladenine glycosylase